MIKQKEPEINLKIEKMCHDYVDDIYNLYIDNNSFYDESVGKKILSAENHYSYNDFYDLLNDDGTIGYILLENKKINTYNSYNKQNESTINNFFKGFIVFEILKEKVPVYSILFLEVNKEQTEIINVAYAKLFGVLKEKLGQKFEAHKIRIEVLDGNYDLMKILFINGFKQKELVNSKKGPDIFIFEFGPV